MPRYIVSSEGPISVHQLNRPDLPEFPDRPVDPGYGVEGPERPELPPIPPREEWPPLPPWLQPGVGLPIPPSIAHPIVPIDPDVDTDELPEIWPPPTHPPQLPDLSGKTLALACIYVSGHGGYYAWVVIDHEEAKEKAKKALAAIKAKLPAGGLGGNPPPRPQPK